MIKTNRLLLDHLSQFKKPNGPIQEEFVAKGKRLLWQGLTTNVVYCLISGIVKCFISEENGRDYVLEFLGEGELIGELEILTGADSISNIEALTDIRILRIDQPFFHELLTTDVTFNQLVMQELAIRLMHTAQRASFQQTYPIEFAVLKILYLFSMHHETVSKQDIADYLGITIRSLNRLLKQLKARQIIQETKQGIFIVDEQLSEPKTGNLAASSTGQVYPESGLT